VEPALNRTQARIKDGVLLALHLEFAKGLFRPRVPAKLNVRGVLQQVDEAVAF